MLHRFRQPELGIEGHGVESVCGILARLRRQRIAILGLEELFRRIRERAPVGRAVAFTIDDGYLGHATIAAPAFAAYDAPVTTFVTSGFLDRLLWFWWDKIEHVFHQTPRRRLEVRYEDQTLVYEWTDPASRNQAQLDLTERCKRIQGAAKYQLIEALACAADVELPLSPPPQYEPMSWEDLRRCETTGMRFGPHTVSHPVLAMADAAQSRHELAESWRRVSAEAKYPVKVFCYPNGRRQDFGPREIGMLRELGFDAAVTSEPGHVCPEEFRASPEAPFRVRRFHLPDDPTTFLLYANGVAQFAARLRERGTE